MRTPLLLLLLAALSALAAIAVLQAPDGKLHVFFLDVEAGQGILVRTPSARWLLIDGGPRPGPVLAALGRHLPFWQRTIHTVIATHDGETALLPQLEVASRYRVTQAVGPSRVESLSGVHSAWLSLLVGRSIPLAEAQPGLLVDCADGVTLEIVAASSDGAALRLVYGELSLLLPGLLPVAGSMASSSSVVALPAYSAASAAQARVLAQSARSLILLSGPRSDTAQAAPSAPGAQVVSTRTSGTLELISDGWSHTIRAAR